MLDNEDRGQPVLPGDPGAGVITARRSDSLGPTKELLLKAALLEGDAALSAWRAWQAADSVTGTDQDSGRLFPLVWLNLKALGLAEPDMAVLKSAYRHQWLANQVRLGDVGQALRVLEEAGIETMVLKGAGLALRHYPSIGARPMYDVDVLVRPEFALTAARLLLQAGWSQFLPAELELLLPATHGTAFTAPTGSKLDLHWYALWSPALDDDFWSSADPLQVGGAATLVPCPADQLLHVCVHGSWSEYPLARWVADALAVMRSTPSLNWTRVIDRASARSLTLPLSDALHYLRDIFGAPVPQPVLDQLDEARCGFFERAVDRAWHASPGKLPGAWLMLERYRRLRSLPRGATNQANLWRYFRAYATVALGLDSGRLLMPALLRALLPRLT